MEKTNKKKLRGTHKAAFPVGLLVFLLAAIGLVTIVMGAVSAVDKAVEKSKNLEEYENMLIPVLLIDPDTFDDITKADMNQLLEISIWSLLKSDISPDTYSASAEGLIIPKADVEAQFVKLFGTEVKPVHATVEGYGMAFIYDSANATYTVPLTGITPIYTPKIVEKTTTSNSIVLTVACLAGDAWEQGEDGDMIAPAPDKYLKITLREKDGNYYISAIQNTSTPEVATTNEQQNAGTTENRDLLEQAEVTATETTAPSEPSSDEASETESATE